MIVVRICWISAMVLAVVSVDVVQPPPSPCPLVFTYESSPSAAMGWRGVVRLLAPHKFSSLHLEVSLVVPGLVLPAEPSPATLSLRGGVQAARALTRAVHEGRRNVVVEFVADFACGVTAVPAVINVTANGRTFCSAAQGQGVGSAATQSTISLVSNLRTGLDWAAASDQDFAVAPEGAKALTTHDETSAPMRCVTSADEPVVSNQPFSVNMPSVNTPSVSSQPASVPAYPTATLTPSPSYHNHHPAYVLPAPHYNDYAPPTPSTPPPAMPPPSTPPPRTPSPSTPPPAVEPVPDVPVYAGAGPAPEDPAPPPHIVEGEECGRPWGGPNPLVTRGAAAVRGRWPWLVALFKKLGRRDQLGLNFECGASLVSRKHVVTAAHCVEVRGRRRKPVDPAVLVVYLGKHDLLSYTEPGQQTAEVSAVKIHPDYGHGAASSATSSGTSSGYNNDLALLVMTDPIEPTKTIRPVCLWEGGSDIAGVVGKVGAVPGWGKDDTGAISNEIRVANMPIVSQETCLRSNVFFHSFTSNRTFCAGFKNGTSVCNGDSGGGLFIKGVDGRWRIRGIVSVSMFSVNDQSCDSYNYAVFTDVAQFLPWLREQMYS